jgi:DNA excision repair protein ERCC-6-like 2
MNLLIPCMLTLPRSDPAHDLQAMDRAYRFGQTRDVSVYRLLGRHSKRRLSHLVNLWNAGTGSLEELIYARQVYKQQQMRIGYEASIQTRLDLVICVGTA